MGTKLNKYGYEKLINENIDALEKHMPKHSLHKKHIIEVLNWSVEQLYNQNNSIIKASWVSADGVEFWCSNCQTEKDEYFVDLKWKYCPNCGAYMKNDI